MSQNGSTALAQRGHEIGLDGFRVLHALMGMLDYENYIHASQGDIGEILGMHRQHVNRALKRLIEIEVVLAGPRVGNRPSYRLNPEYGWKGKPISHRKALADRMKAAKIRVVT